MQSFQNLADIPRIWIELNNQNHLAGLKEQITELDGLVCTYEHIESSRSENSQSLPVGGTTLV